MSQLYTYPDQKKGKLNKLKIGQKVQVKSAHIDWVATHLSSLYSVQGEIQERSLEEVYFITRAKIIGKMPFGITKRYGMLDNDDKIDRRVVFVEFKIRAEGRDFFYRCYLNEKDLVKITEKAKK